MTVEGLKILYQEASRVVNKKYHTNLPADVKFVTQFDDKTFEPSEKLNETFLFDNKKYKIAYARGVSPSGDINIVWIVYARRVN